MEVRFKVAICELILSFKDKNVSILKTMLAIYHP
jgi:hypothetical protein